MANRTLMIGTMQHRHDTASNWYSKNPILAEGEIGVETDTGIIKGGDGTTPWNSLKQPSSYILPNATSSVLGGVKVGDNISVSDGMISVANGSTSAKGVVQLSSSVNSSSTSLAATASAVKSAYDLANSKQSPATSLSGYGIADAYTKDEVDNLIANSGGSGGSTSGTADRLTTARTISLSTDATGSVAFDGSQDVTLAVTLANSGVTASSYGQSANTTLSNGGSFKVPYLTIDKKGRVTKAYTRTVTLPNIETGGSSGGGDISLGYFPAESYWFLDNSSAFPTYHQSGVQFYAFDLGAIYVGVPRYVSIQGSYSDDGSPLTCYGVTTIAASSSDLEYCAWYDQGHTEFNSGTYPLEAFTLQVPYYSLDDSYHAYVLITGNIIQDLSKLTVICYQ